MLFYETVENVLNVLSMVKQYPPKFFTENIDFSKITVKQLNFEELKSFGYFENGKKLSEFIGRKSIYSAITHNGTTFFQRRPKIYELIKDTLVKLDNLKIN